MVISRAKFFGACVAGMLIGGLLGFGFFGVFLGINDMSSTTVDIRGFYTVPKGWYLNDVDSGWVCHVVGVLNGSVKPEKTFNGFRKYSFIHRGNKTIVCDAMIGHYVKDGIEYYTEEGPRTGVFYSDYAVITIYKEFNWNRFKYGVVASMFCELLFLVALYIVIRLEESEGGGNNG